MNYWQDYYRRNRQSVLVKHAAWRAANPRYMQRYHKRNSARLENGVRDRAYRRKYGITLERYNAMVLKQNGRCALCRRASHDRRLAVDHDHKTGRVRGLLCTPCNRIILGRVDTIPGFLKRLNRYVAKATSVSRL